MKRYLILIIGMMFIPMLFAVSDPPCEMDYPDIECTEVSYNEFVQIPCATDSNYSLFVKFTYCYRYVTDPNTGEIFRDVMIYEDIECASGNLCDSCNLELSLYKYILERQFDELNIHGLPGGNENCITNFRVFVEPCWQNNEYFEPGIGYIYSASPCPEEDEECCRHTYEICFVDYCTQNPNLGVRMTKINTIDSYDPMTECIEPCITNCDFWDFNWQRVIFEKRIEYDIFENEDSDVRIMPNPTNGIIHISFLDIKSENINITVFDNLGKVVLIKELDSTCDNEIDLTKYSKGIYYFNIQISNSIIYNGKIVNY